MEHAVQQLFARCTQLVDARLKEIADVWRRVGGDERQLTERRLPALAASLDESLQQLVRREVDAELSLSDACDAKEAKIRRLAAELGTGADADDSSEEEEKQLQRLSVATLRSREQQLSRRMQRLHCAQLKLRMRAVYEQMRTIWRRLQLPEQQRTQWEKLLQLRRPTEADSRKLDAELLRLRGEVLPRMPEYIRSCRDEIRHLRRATFASAKEAADFADAFESANYDEELLQRHEAEAARLRRRHEASREFYAAAADWRDAWEAVQLLRRQLKDPGVLTNRGGILLRIEKETKRATAAADAKEAELLRLCRQLGDRAPQLDGRRPHEFVAAVKLLAEAEKENEARRRQAKHDSTLRREMRYGSRPASPVMRRQAGHNCTRAAGHCSTRHVPTAAAAAASRGRRPGAQKGSYLPQASQSAIGDGRIVKAKQRKSTSLRVSGRLTRQELQQLCNNSTIGDLPDARPESAAIGDVSSSTNYSEFQLGIAFRSSSVLPTTAGLSSAHDSGLSSLEHRH